MVLLPVANLQERGGNEDYSDLITAGREAVLRTLAAAGIGDLRSHIVSELIIDPVEWDKRYALQHGAAFGLSHGLDQLAMLRPGCADDQVQGLYFVGASSRPGNGVPLVMLGAGTAARRIVADLKQTGALT
jgi:phytoene desaturase (3,4-didehydrolycopene-forming)